MADKLSIILSDPLKRASLERRLALGIIHGGIDECWPWIGALTGRGGYGHLSVGRGFVIRSHRAIRALKNGPIPSGFLVCHRCDNPPCCNPSHLFLGSAADNTKDMMRKGRNSAPPLHLGESHPRSTLTEDKVRAIRCAMPLPWGGRKRLAEQLGVSLKNVSDVVNNKVWGHVDAY